MERPEISMGGFGTINHYNDLMAHRVTVRPAVSDAKARDYLKTIGAIFPKIDLQGVAVTAAYTIDAKLNAGECEKIAKRLTNPVTEEYSSNEVLAPGSYAYSIEIGYLPGVTDNVGNTAKQTAEDCLGRRFKDGEEIYSSAFIFLIGSIAAGEAESIARELHNPLIERATISSEAQARKAGFPIIVPKVSLGRGGEHVSEVNLNIDEAELVKIGKEGIKNADGSSRGPLALSLRAMRIIRDYFKKLGRNPTDIELESLAQTWSEHCKHTIFADPLDEVKEGIYRKYIKGATQEIRAKKGKRDFCVSVFTDNSGAIAFDEKYLVTHKVETHNAPSALDPFGGSVTAIVGVNRDCLGFGLGAKPIANIYGFCVGNPQVSPELFRDKERKQQLLPARRILEGVVRGVNAGGNQSGIPTALGFVATDRSFRGKPLVFGGTVGIIPRKIGKRKMFEKKARAGDCVVMVGGRVGADGIHGATFSSESLSSGSPATAVQIGDPVTQKKFSDALIRDARDSGLYSSITDNGAGGLSGSIGEMAKESGGCIVDLEKVPLKYHGLAPWQIWISESQERMTLAVPEKNWTALKKIFDRHAVEATRIGEFTNSGSCVVRYKKKKILDIEMSFLHDGRPVEVQKSKSIARANPEPAETARGGDLKHAISGILSRPNVGGISFISRQYDHEVQGTSVTKPLQGRGMVNADSAVLKPLPNSARGIVLAHGYCPWYSAIDTYAMAAAAIDTAVRNAICAGASRDYLAILDNFCWSSSDTPERLYELKQAARACFDVATAYGTPFISGKDSMYNDFKGFTSAGKPIHIAALPTLLISALGVIPDVATAVTLDLKMPGDSIYLIGETNDELGGSEYFSMLGFVGNKVPVVDTKKNASIYDAVANAIQNGLVASAIDVGRGGLAVALTKLTIAGGLGINADLSRLSGDARRADSILFSESQGRILVSIRPDAEKKFKTLMQTIYCTKLGEVLDMPTLSLKLPETKVELSLAALSNSYQSPFKNW